MAQTKTGAMIATARKSGLTLVEYQQRLALGLKRCTRCKEWQDIAGFGKDSTRLDGLDSTCFGCRRVKIRKPTKGRVSNFRGRKHTDEAKQKCAAANRGRKHPARQPLSIEVRKKMSLARRASSKVARGRDHHSYKDGKLAERRGSRFSIEYKRWRYDVYVRDRFTCQHCGDSRGGNLNAHHINAFAEFPDLIYEVSNGITLCDVCHKKVHAKDAE